MAQAPPIVVRASRAAAGIVVVICAIAAFAMYKPGPVETTAAEPEALPASVHGDDEAPDENGD